MVHYVHTKFCPILKGSGANFCSVDIWNDPCTTVIIDRKYSVRP